MRYIWAAATHQGMARTNNEDTVFPETSGESTGPAVLMVADGMGGHIAGEVASRLAVNTAASSDLAPADRVAAANRAIREQVARQPDLEGMATTLTLVELTPEGVAHFGHIGDSRAYLYRDGELRQLTDDHTVVAQYVAAGTLSPEEAADHPHSHMLTRCLGLTRFVNVDEIEVPLEPGDRLLALLRRAHPDAHRRRDRREPGHRVGRRDRLGPHRSRPTRREATTTSP